MQHDTHPPDPHDHAGDHGPHHGSMGERGVTRHGMHAGHDDANHHDAGHHDANHAGGQMHEMSEQDRRRMVVTHHRRTLWVWWTLVLLGLWTAAAPLTFDYRLGAVDVPGRSVWLSLDARVGALFWSDLLSGLLLAFLGWRTLTPGRPFSRWAACFVGVWLTFAPVLFWSPSMLAYLNDTIVGALVIALTILVPGMPSMVMMMKTGPEVPPGWSYNPSSWPQRWVMIALAFAGWLVSRYLAAFQLGYTDRAWDPFFGDGSRRVLLSDMSHMWPISDAALGALSYTFEFLMGFMGSPARWRTMPWMVLFFGVLIIPLGLTHVVLVVSQPVVVGQWCTLCLLAAAIMLPMIPLSVDEVVAMCQFMRKAVWRDGKPFWRTFWKGDTLEMTEDGRGGADERTPDLADLPSRPLAVVRASTWGVSAPWPLALATVLGLYMMIAPTLLGTAAGDPTGNFSLTDSNHLAGAAVVVAAVCAMGEVIRAGRYLNVLLGLWLAATPLFLAGGNTASTVNNVIVGLALIVLSLPRGKVVERYGRWDQCIF